MMAEKDKIEIQNLELIRKEEKLKIGIKDLKTATGIFFLQFDCYIILLVVFQFKFIYGHSLFFVYLFVTSLHYFFYSYITSHICLIFFFIHESIFM